MTKSSLAYFLNQPRSLGNVEMQGPHHVAQKSRSTTFPRSWARSTGSRPIHSSIAIFGAGSAEANDSTFCINFFSEKPLPSTKSITFLYKLADGSAKDSARASASDSSALSAFLFFL